MKNKNIRKKGMTLIEAIISVALFSILIIPISGLVMTAMQTSKKSELKQEASYVGQSLLEEMNVYDEITIKDGSFKLLDGDEIYKKSDSLYEDNGNIIRNGFNVEVTLEKDINFQYKPSSEEERDDSKMDFILRLSKNVILGKTEVKCNDKTKVIPNELVIKIDEFGNMKLIDKKTNIEITQEPKVSNSSNKISIYLDENFSNEKINIDIKNENRKENVVDNKETLEIYIKSSQETTDKLNVTGVKGKVRVYENIIDIPKGEVGDLYNVKVDVKKNNDVLFTGKTTKNIVIK